MSDDTEPGMDDSGSRPRSSSTTSSWTDDGTVDAQSCTGNGSAYTFDRLYASLFGMPTVAEDVAFGPANFGVDGQALAERVEEALAAVGMSEQAGRSPHHLSGGQRRRGALASVLACRPDVLVLDEPSANLDPVARRELAETLIGLDTTMIVVTHDLPYAAQLCDRAVIVDDGRVVADGAILDVLADAETLARHRLELPWGFDVDTMRALSERTGRRVSTG